MTHSEERELEVIKEGLSYAMMDSNSDQPYACKIPLEREPGISTKQQKDGGMHIFQDRETTVQRAPMESCLSCTGT